MPPNDTPAGVQTPAHPKRNRPTARRELFPQEEAAPSKDKENQENNGSTEPSEALQLRSRAISRDVKPLRKNKGHSNSSFDRLSKTDRKGHLVCSERDYQKLKNFLGEDLLNQLPILKNSAEELSEREQFNCTPKKLNIDNHAFSSPLKIIYVEDPDSPHKPASRSRTHLASKQKNSLPLYDQNEKIIEAKINLKTIKKARKNKRIACSKAFQGQSAAQLDPEAEYAEFLHLLAHIFGGEVSVENLTSGSWYANSQMLTFDTIAKRLLEKKLCQYIDVKIAVTLEKNEQGENTHRAESICMHYTLDNGMSFSSYPIRGKSHRRPCRNEFSSLYQLLLLILDPSQHTKKSLPLQQSQNLKAVEKQEAQPPLSENHYTLYFHKKAPLPPIEDLEASYSKLSI